MKKRIFGHIPDVKVGDKFNNRDLLSKAGVHGPTVAGISGSKYVGSDSIVLSGGYEDDEDFGDVIIYTGAGGQNSKKKQVADQTLDSVNLSLAKSKTESLPVRVVRGHNHKSEYSPKSGYQYSGLYLVEDYWKEVGKAGYIIWRYRLVSFDSSAPTTEVNEPPADYVDPKRKSSSSNKIVRDYQKALNVKNWHKYKCQVCGLAIETSAGLYAEAAHIKPLGEPHNGPDSEHNILCLCPNHHVMFDNGGFTIADDFTLIGLPGELTQVKVHKVDIRFIKYHREHYYKNT
ncbi:YDG/SRA domain-containing protein [Vibrio neonatus]|uniref:YDG/SRA domain-containing protein n=1 Tax=Vibrio neonatus TaxID=278860 RepID=UPI0021C497F0|nr:YDG/SRA domain-containing protein [Vibrio neonatus]